MDIDILKMHFLDFKLYYHILGRGKPPPQTPPLEKIKKNKHYKMVYV